MLAKNYKIQKKKEVEAVFKNGRSSFDDIVGVKILPTAQGNSRFVVVVSTKVSKKAIERNRVKRKLSEICRLSLTRLAAGNDFFILALPASVQKTYRELENSLLRHFKKLGVYKQ
ncbi:ribonuclease P protein component [Candidatus Falkowbacteria bacterium RIFOXYC2_FULL_47_12]|uniref:Ribonuclease P protein component n=2 Tax=Candidatus Falkowiibacteriota TaxID=1752728 RepID=A0A1F5TMI3_9BACT|nr:MAG: ribonuclease P protein component [Candidatus Falkowbacteria bacterium RIFOXYA2_FULL_47_9]OGF40140.1 MAG: ribonuclease P protein component [Candidatus Falkowbacteria bacterium RIFOXYC2_FULL_47_12]